MSAVLFMGRQLHGTPFALISHAGSAHSGHCQMAFQIGAGRERVSTMSLAMNKAKDMNIHKAAPFAAAQNEFAGISTADFTRPSEARPLRNELPALFRCGISTIWLVRSD